MFDLDAALRHIVSEAGSDLHLKVGSQPRTRVRGALVPMEGSDRLRAEDTERVLQEALQDAAKTKEFQTDQEVDFSFGVNGLARFRVNAFRQRGSISIVMRVIPFSVRTVADLGLPEVIRDIANEERGLILLTGTTGSGKSTTLAAIIDHINTTRACHIVTIEDPIEYLHSDRQSIINQREVGMDTLSFDRAMRRVLRQDPDVILIGEMRDEETVRAALSAAETGHLVLSTVHTLDAPESVNRIIDFFPPHEQSQARSMLAGTLRGVVSQRLVRTKDGGGRVAACEILRMTGRARDMILDPDETGRLREVITEGAYYGMQTFDQALLGLVQSEQVALDDALRVASSPHDFTLLLASGGRTSTSMKDIVREEQPADASAPQARPVEPVPGRGPTRSASVAAPPGPPRASSAPPGVAA